MTEPAAHSGRCLCGAVRYRAEGLRDIWFCHCVQCRRVTGHIMAACRTERERFSVAGDVVWTAHSGTSELGRCAACASPLFWRQAGSPTMSALAGSLDHTRGIEVIGHAFLAEKGDYYTVADGLARYHGTPADGF